MKTLYVVEQKVNGKWVSTDWYNDVATEVYKDLSKDLIAKKINKCTYIQSIKRIPLYNGFQRIIVTYDNNVRRIYTIEN